MTLPNLAAKTRFLVLHDYGMGGSWWWVHAGSAREILEAFAWTEVVTRPESVTWAEGEKLEEVDIDAPLMPPGLDDLRAERDAQRGLPGFGALADRSIVYVRRHWDSEDDGGPVYLMEVESDGRRTREVELAEDGSGRIRSGPDDWPFNPPVVDFFAPELAGQEITKEEFEEQWERAEPAAGL